jgi:hypothetical protein
VFPLWASGRKGQREDSGTQTAPLGTFHPPQRENLRIIRLTSVGRILSIQ